MIAPMIVLAWLIAIGTLAFLLSFALDAALGVQHMHRLADIAPELPGGEPWPRLSIVIAGRNEERNIEHALRSVLALDYPDLEIVFVNDRSTDRTGEIVRRVGASDPRVRLAEITELPPHWLGKNHALHEGASAATGEWILFTDADVVFHPLTLRRAIAYARSQQLDHLTAGAHISGPTLPLRVFIAGFAFFFLMYARPWRARNADPRSHVGVGAFNLVRAAKYREAGGHQPIAMRPDDDMKLAKLLKLHGARSALIDAGNNITVEWYPNVAEAVRGLEKNAFSGVDYSWLKLIASSVAVLTFVLAPWIGLFLAHGALRWTELAILLFLFVMVGGIASGSGGRFLYALGFPLATLLFLFMLWNSAIKAERNGGIDWRGTLYPLDELRANRI